MYSKSARILFVDADNTGCSQIAQALACYKLDGSACVESAGIRPGKELLPMALKLIGDYEMGPSNHYPKSLLVLAEQVGST